MEATPCAGDQSSYDGSPGAASTTASPTGTEMQDQDDTFRRSDMGSMLVDLHSQTASDQKARIAPAISTDFEAVQDKTDHANYRIDEVATDVGELLELKADADTLLQALETKLDLAPSQEATVAADLSAAVEIDRAHAPVWRDGALRPAYHRQGEMAQPPSQGR